MLTFWRLFYFCTLSWLFWWSLFCERINVCVEMWTLRLIEGSFFSFFSFYFWSLSWIQACRLLAVMRKTFDISTTSSSNYDEFITNLKKLFVLQLWESDLHFYTKTDQHHEKKQTFNFIILSLKTQHVWLINRWSEKVSALGRNFTQQLFTAQKQRHWFIHEAKTKLEEDTSLITTRWRLNQELRYWPCSLTGNLTSEI